MTVARVIPEREAWIHDDPEIRADITEGLRQAREGEFAPSPPDIDADAQSLERIEDGYV